jgi:hypothetical protein
MFELIFVDRETGRVNYAIDRVSRVRYITPSEVGFDKEGRPGSASFTRTEKLEVERMTPGQLVQRPASMPTVGESPIMSVCTCEHELSQHPPDRHRPFAWPCVICGCAEYEEKTA